MPFGANVLSHWWVILIVVILIFGAAKLPALARSIGQSVNILKSEVKSGKDSATDKDDTATTASDRT